MRWSAEDGCAGVNLVKLLARASKGAITYVVEAFQNGASRVSRSPIVSSRGATSCSSTARISS
jgi:hypothetical protein